MLLQNQSDGSQRVVAGDVNLLNDLKLKKRAEELQQGNGQQNNGVHVPKVEMPALPSTTPAPGAMLQTGLGLEGLHELFGEVAPVFIRVGIPAKGNTLVYYIKQHSQLEESGLLAQMDRMDNQAITPMDRNALDAHCYALGISESVFVNNGTEESPNYVKRFTYHELLGQKEEKDSQGNVVIPRIVGMFEYADSDAKTFINTLSANVYSVNPALNIEQKKMAQRIMIESLSGE